MRTYPRTMHQTPAPAPMYAAPNITFTDGVPNVDHLPSTTITDEHGEPYMVRYDIHVDDAAVRVHHILKSDTQDLHDHPWDFMSTILAGSYTEITEDSSHTYTAPCVLFREAEMAHRLELNDGPVWTLVVTGPVRRRWGFYTDTGWVHWREYLTGDA